MAVKMASDPRLEMTEKDWQTEVTRIAKQWGWLVYHTFLSRWSAPGYPDLVMVNTARKQIIYAELKRERGKLSEKQQEWIEALRACGQQVFVWRPSDIEEVMEILTGARVVL